MSENLPSRFFNNSSYTWPLSNLTTGLLIVFLALGMRLLWMVIYRDILGSGVPYLWISEYLTRGEWRLFPQAWTSPLVPGAIGVLSWITGENLWTGRILGILGNTLAVGLAMLLFRRVAPERPAIAWLVGLGLAVNMVWCRMAVIILTENFFYPALMGLWLALLWIREKFTWPRGLAFGAIWGLLYLSREIGLYYGGLLVVVLAAVTFWESGTGGRRLVGLFRFALPVLIGFLLIAGGWIIWLSHDLGTFSLGGGPRIYVGAALTDQSGQRFEHYDHGTMGLFKYKPYEIQQYTRFPRPGEERYPRSSIRQLLSHPRLLLQRLWKNLGRSIKEFKKVTLIGLLMVVAVLPILMLSGVFPRSPALIWLWVANGILLGLHLMTFVYDRLVGWFFPLLYYGLALFTLWVWDWLCHRPWNPKLKLSGLLLIIGLFGAHVVYQNTRLLPQYWYKYQGPRVSQVAAAQILKSYGPGAVISSQAGPVAYWARGSWIGLPSGRAADLVEWLYLGGADYFFILPNYPPTEAQQVFWADPAAIHRQYPELELVGDYNLTHAGGRARLFRFRPRPEKLAKLRQRYPWAGTRPQ